MQSVPCSLTLWSVLMTTMLHCIYLPGSDEVDDTSSETKEQSGIKTKRCSSWQDYQHSCLTVTKAQDWN
jgi:hypothetical protein